MDSKGLEVGPLEIDKVVNKILDNKELEMSPLEIDKVVNKILDNKELEMSPLEIDKVVNKILDNKELEMSPLEIDKVVNKILDNKELEMSPLEIDKVVNKILDNKELEMSPLEIDKVVNKILDNKELEMSPLEIDKVLHRIMTHLPHTDDLNSCRLVNQQWNSMSASVLNDRGVTVVVSDKNYQEFFNNRAKHIAGQNISLELSGQPDGRSRALLSMIKMLREDKSDNGTGRTGSYCVKSINYKSPLMTPNEFLEETLFWLLVDIVAPDLEHLLVAGPLKPAPGQQEELKDTTPPPEPGTQFPALKSVIFDVRRHNRQKFVPRKLIQILTNAPGLEDYKLISDQRVAFEKESIGKEITFIPNEANPANFGQLAAQLKTFGFFIVENEDDLLPLLVVSAVSGTGFQNLQKLTVLQYNNFACRPQFVQFLARNAETLTSIEYTFTYMFGVKSKLLLLPSRPPVLPYVTKFGLFYRVIFNEMDLTKPGMPGIPDITILHPVVFAEMVVHLRLTCLACPNLKTLEIDMNICLAIALYEFDKDKKNRRDGSGDVAGQGPSSLPGPDRKDTKKNTGQPTNQDEPASTSKSVSGSNSDAISYDLDEDGLDLLESFFAESAQIWKEKNLSVTTLEVTITTDMFTAEIEDPNDFGACMARYWPERFPALNKLVVNIEIWPDDEVELRLPGLLNIPGITDLEIINYWNDWIGQELAKKKKKKRRGGRGGRGSGSGSLANLQSDLRILRLSATQDMARIRDLLALLVPTPEKMVPLKWPEGVLRLCDSFQVLEEVVIGRRVFLNTTRPGPVVGRITSDKGVKITVL